MKKIKMLQLVVILSLMVVIIFVLYREFFKDSLNPHFNKASPQEVAFDTFTTNVEGGEFNFLKMNITLLTANKKDAKFIKTNKSTIRRFLLNLFSEQNGRTILEDKESFERTIKKKIKERFDINIVRVYFTDFVLAD